jgi:hypothetical protein
MEDIAIIDIIVPPPSVIEVVAGTKGDPGPPGPPGPSSSVFFYRVDANATAPNDPGAGKVRYNAAVQADATAFYVDWLTADGFDAHLYFQLVTIGQRLVMQDKDLAVNYQVWELTGPAINHPDWFEVPVAFVSSTMAGGFSHNTNVAVLLVAEGGAALPTAPLGQVLVSRGDGIPPVFSETVLLRDIVGGNGGWRLGTLPSGNLDIRRISAAGLPENPHLEIDPYSGGFSTIYGGFNALNGNISVKWITPNQHTLAELMAVAATVGNLGTISDSTTNTPGAVISGGGTFNVLARWNGTNWIVIGG